ncbi:MAG: ABC transporter ATP-binding protein [Alphaproteobacteria bacterium]
MSDLSIKDLFIKFRTNDGLVHAVNGVSFDLKAGQKLALVGESGSGKSQIAYSILGLLAQNGFAEGKIEFQGQDLLSLSSKQLNKIRSKKIGFIFQDPMSALNPYVRIGKQLTEVLTLHEGLSGSAARARVLEVMEAVKIPDAKSRLSAYPFEFSGGMRQRIVIAMALLCKPDVLIADEPTTALDVTVQAQIMTLLDEIQQEFGTSILLITHDLGLVAGFCDDVNVLYGGRLMEKASVNEMFTNASHPYSRGLLDAVPDMTNEVVELKAIPGSPPNMLMDLKGCPFAPRCVHAVEKCLQQVPELTHKAPFRACHISPEQLS